MRNSGAKDNFFYSSKKLADIKMTLKIRQFVINHKLSYEKNQLICRKLILY